MTNYNLKPNLKNVFQFYKTKINFNTLKKILNLEFVYISLILATMNKHLNLKQLKLFYSFFLKTLTIIAEYFSGSIFFLTLL